MAVQLLIADDHEIVRLGLATLLKGSGIVVAGDATNGREAVDKAVKLKPDVLLWDARMSERDGMAALQQLRQRMPRLPVVMFSAHDTPNLRAQSAALGAVDFLLKGVDRKTLIDAILKASKTDPAATQPRSNPRGKNNHGSVLTPRETEVIRLVVLGLTNQQIGNSLGISVETVKEHVQNILRKLNAADRTQAAVWALKNGVAS